MTEPTTTLPSPDFIRGHLHAIGMHEVHSSTCGCPQIAAYVPHLLARIQELMDAPAEDEPGSTNDLTETELEVARLLAKRFTYGEIAGQQYVSINTIKTHAKHIYRKLGVIRRADLAAVLRREAVIR